MDINTTERIRIANTHNAFAIDKNNLTKPIFKNISAFNFYMTYGMLILSSVASLSELFNLLPLKWNMAGLLVTLTFPIALRWPNIHLKYILKQHIENLSKQNYQFSTSLNTELDRLITNHNRRTNQFYIRNIFFIFLTVAAALQVFDLNPYWHHFPAIVLLSCLYLLIRITFNFKMIKKNIKQVETS